MILGGALAWSYMRGAQASVNENLRPVYNPPIQPPDNFQGAPGSYVEVTLPNAPENFDTWDMPLTDTWTYPITAEAVAPVPQIEYDTWDMAPPDYANTLSQESKNLDAFLYVIRLIESGNDYNRIAGGARFTSFADHPYILNPNLAKPAGTTASGAYQIVVGTWREARAAEGLADFSPGSQDVAAIYLLEKRGAFADVIAGNFAGAILKLPAEWDAFKKMLAGAYPITLAQAQAAYQAQGGMIA